MCFDNWNVLITEVPISDCMYVCMSLALNENSVLLRVEPSDTLETRTRQNNFYFYPALPHTTPSLSTEINTGKVRINLARDWKSQGKPHALKFVPFDHKSDTPLSCTDAPNDSASEKNKKGQQKIKLTTTVSVKCQILREENLLPWWWYQFYAENLHIYKLHIPIH